MRAGRKKIWRMIIPEVGKALSIYFALSSCILIIALSLSQSAKALSQPGKPGAYFWGDVNGNGIIDANDITVIQNAYAGGSYTIQDVIPDSGYTQELNGNGLWADADDITRLKDYFKGDFSAKPGQPDVVVVDGATHITLMEGDSVEISAYALDNAGASDGKADKRAGWGIVFRVNTAPANGRCTDVYIQGRDVLPQGTDGDSILWFPHVSRGNTAEAFAYTLDANTIDQGLATVKIMAGPGCLPEDSIEVSVFIPSDAEARIGQSRNPFTIGPENIQVIISYCIDNDGDGYGNYCALGPDCDDGNGDVYPGAPELCDGVDNQCPGDAGFGFLEEGCAAGDEWPVLAGNYTSYTATFATDIYVSGNYAYITGLFMSESFEIVGGLEIIDVSDPTFPSLAGGCSVLVPYEKTLTIRVNGVYVKDNYAYVADDNQGLHIFDVSNPSAITLTGSYTTDAQAVHVSGDYAYVTGSSGLQIIDVSDPSSPTLAGEYGSLDNAYDIYVQGDYAYIADNSGLRIINVFDKSSPAPAGTYPMSTLYPAIQVEGDHAYVTDGDTGLKIINISDPYSPALTGQYDTPGYPGYARGISVVGNYAYLTDLVGAVQCFLLIINVSDPASPTLAGQYSYDSPDTMDAALHVTGDYAYVVHFEGAGLQIIQVMR
jgi:hypothetical protein